MAGCDCLQDRSVFWLCGGIQSRPSGLVGRADPIGAPLAGGGSLWRARCAPATCCNRLTPTS